MMQANPFTVYVINKFSLSIILAKFCRYVPKKVMLKQISFRSVLELATDLQHVMCRYIFHILHKSKIVLN